MWYKSGSNNPSDTFEAGLDSQEEDGLFVRAEASEWWASVSAMLAPVGIAPLYPWPHYFEINTVGLQKQDRKCLTKIAYFDQLGGS